MSQNQSTIRFHDQIIKLFLFFVLIIKVIVKLQTWHTNCEF